MAGLAFKTLVACIFTGAITIVGAQTATIGGVTLTNLGLVGVGRVPAAQKDKFGETFGFTCGGAVGHTACMAFGLERVALALVNVHGPDPRRWPAGVTAKLG